MANNNLELALRIRTDVAQAVSQLNSLQSNITQIGQATSTAQKQSAQATNQATQAINRTASALENASDSLDLGSSIRQAQRLGQAMEDTAQATQNNITINEQMEQSLRSLTPHFLSLIGLSGGLLTASLNALEKSAQLKNLSNISGMNVEQFQYYVAGAKSVGIEMDKLSDIFKDTRDKVGDFLTTDGGELQDFFEQIAPQVGVTAEQFRHLSGADALQLYVNSLREANVSENEMIFYMESIADEASALLPLLNEGGEGFRKYGEQAQRAGAILSQTAVNDALKAKSAISEFSNEMQGVGNRIVVNLIPALQFVSQHLDALVKAGIIVASVFAGRMTASLVATTVAFIAGQAEAMRYQMALARMADVSALTATRLNALAMTSRLLTASGGFIGLGVAVASTIAGFLLMRKSSDDVATSLDDQRKSVAELKAEYSQLSEIQKRVKYGEQLDKINELAKVYHKQSDALEDVILDSKGFYRASIEQQDQIYALVQAYKNGSLSAEQLANELNKLGFVSDELKRRIDKQATATALAKNELDNANDVLSAYQGKAISATSATNGLSSGLDNVGRSAEKNHRQDWRIVQAVQGFNGADQKRYF
nr:MAG TPA: tail tape measure [Caudoviricetes sp.]